MPSSLADTLKKHSCLYASFDQDINAEHSRGNGQATYQPSIVQHSPTAGRHGGALIFSAADYGWAEDEFSFAAKDNFPYKTTAFAGTVSMWLCGNPDTDLNPDYPVDPFHISRRAADASFYLDLTRPNDERYGSPRKLRFGLYNDSPANDRYVGGQLIVVGDLHWQHDRWHHLVATWDQANSGQANAGATVYIDGVRRGWMAGYEHRLSWDIAALRIGLGQRYSGKMSELLILDTALNAPQVETLYQLPALAGSLF